MSGERTEAATPRRLAHLREEGRAPRSPDLVSALGLVVGFWALQASGSAVADRLQQLTAGMFQDLATVASIRDPDLQWPQVVMGRAAQAWLLSVAPLLVSLPLLGIGASLAQGPVFSPKALFKGWNRLNPLTGFQRLFSTESAMGLVRSLGKVILVGWVTAQALQSAVERLPRIQASTDPRQMAAFVGEAVVGVGLAGAQVLLILALADFAYQRWSFNRSARMTKQEVKEEYKQQEGDPQLKAQVRSRQRKLAATRRQFLDVPKAAVVLTNPTHLAVALQYDRAMASPRVIARGAGLIAERIKQIARNAGVPVVENKPLARGLYRSTEIGDDIPLELYQAVAEVLAYVFSLRRRHA